MFKCGFDTTGCGVLAPELSLIFRLDQSSLPLWTWALVLPAGVRRNNTKSQEPHPVSRLFGNIIRCRYPFIDAACL
jgi:hypothetical protein